MSKIHEYNSRYNREKYQQNKELFREKSRQFYANNKEKIKAYTENRQDQIKLYNKTHYENNREQINEKTSYPSGNKSGQMKEGNEVTCRLTNRSID